MWDVSNQQSHDGEWVDRHDVDDRNTKKSGRCRAKVLGKGGSQRSFLKYVKPLLDPFNSSQLHMTLSPPIDQRFQIIYRYFTNIHVAEANGA